MTIQDIRDVISSNTQYFTETDLEELDKILENGATKETEEAQLKANTNKALAAQHKERGNAAYRKENYLEAIEYYTEAIKEDSFDEVLYSNRAAAYAMIKADDQGINDCMVAIKLNPKFAKAYIRLGDFYSSTDYEKAYGYYEQAGKIDPDNAGVKAKIKRLMEKNTSKNTDLASLLKGEGVQKLINSDEFKDALNSIAKGDVDISENLKKLDLK